MPAEELIILFDLGIILLAATIFHYLARMFKQSPLLSYMIAGLIIGPMILGSFGISIGGIPIGINAVSKEILLLSELGVAFLLFSVGVETDLSKVKELGKIVVVGSFVQVVVTALVVIFSTLFLGMLSFEQSLYLGLILAFSSTMIVVKMLSDARQINTLHGRFMIGFLLMQDVLVILAMPLLANIQQILSPLLIITLLIQAIAIIALAFILAKFIYPRFFKFAVQSEELLFLGAVSVCFIFLFLSTALNFSPAIGAFVAGVSLSTLPYSLEVFHKIRGLRDFFATIFFVTLGIQITPEFISFPIQIILLIVFVVFILKPLIYYLITLFSGYGGRISLIVALGLAQVSEFSFILAHQGKAILDQTPGLYSFILLIVAISMALTPYFMSYGNSAYLHANRFISRFLKPSIRTNKLSRRMKELEKLPPKMKDHIVVVGGGAMGSSIADALHKNHSLVVVDHDSEVILKCIGKGMNSLYGSIDNLEIWQKINLKEAKMLILAIPDMKESLYLLDYARKINPKIVVFARAHHYKDALDLYNRGVDFVAMPLIMASNLFLKNIANFLKTGMLDKTESLRDEFIEYLKEKVKEERVLGKA